MQLGYKITNENTRLTFAYPSCKVLFLFLIVLTTKIIEILFQFLQLKLH